MSIKKIDRECFVRKEMLLGNHKIVYRMYPNLCYVGKPEAVEYQSMNICIPEAYFQGKDINGYTKETAPVFLPNRVGGYRAVKVWEPGFDPRRNKPDIASLALGKGYVVACPGTRGRGLYNDNGSNLGKAPACIVDLKAAIRFLRLNRDVICGNMDRIITDGTSAGGGLSALLGAAGNASDYEEELKKLGAAEEKDDVFASMCYCPVTNLDHIDEAFEWMYKDYACYIKPQGFGTDLESLPEIPLDEEQMEHHLALAARFPDYLNSLGLQDIEGTLLTLDRKGTGSFLEHLLSCLEDCAQKEYQKTGTIPADAWLYMENGHMRVKSLEAYTAHIRRVKPPVGYDNLWAYSDENELFSGEKGTGCHFSEYGMEHRKTDAPMADEKIRKMMNPMHYIGDPAAKKAKYWRFRYGTLDRGSSPAIFLMMALKLMQEGANVDYAFSWGIGHRGDYDEEELFRWIDGICKAESERERK
jgi:hypothetical protein